ncbi:iron-containing alcohol dehydrogenase [Primorskyibacter sp. S187A]|uniref:iron-containing alcohol dehydrogenase n=1 Tax=Primorskyibacter sp. S187A TaxID=3415130 RepID=UPI003C7A3C86
MFFSFATSPSIHFGRKAAQQAAPRIIGLSSRVLLVHGKSAERAAWLVEDLTSQGATVETVSCLGEPDINAVSGALRTARAWRPGVIVGLGGGATIDLAKALAALTPSTGPILSYLEIVGDGKALDAAPLPFVAIPTTAGTGAEVTKNSVIGVPEAGKKVSLRAEAMIPDIAIVDPALTDGAPAQVTLSSGLDAVTQVIEPYLSLKASPLTDALCRDAIPRGLRAVFRLAEGEDPQARDDLALTSLFGGMALANAGLGAVHGLAGVIGGRTGAPHGEICATLLPHVLDHNAGALGQDSPAGQRMAEVRSWIAEALGVAPQQAVNALHAKLKSIGIRSIGELGLRHEDIARVAQEAAGASSSKTNPVPLTPDDYVAILEGCYPH